MTPQSESLLSWNEGEVESSLCVQCGKEISEKVKGSPWLHTFVESFLLVRRTADLRLLRGTESQGHVHFDLSF